MLRFPRLALVTALVALGTAPLAAQSPAEILDRYTKTIDPQGKIPSIQGMKSTISMEIPAAGMSANVTTVQRRPNQMSMTIEIPGLGQMRQGFDGETAWSSDPMQGPRILAGAEATAMKDGADINAMARSAAMFTAMEAAGETDVDGDKAACIKLTWKSGRVTTDCFSKSSGLLVESRMKQESPMGEIEAVSRIGDYRDVNGVKIPHRMTQSAMGMQQVMITTGVEFGPQDASLVAVPAEIKALKP